MPGKMPRSYWDACMFLYYINSDPERIATLDALVQEARSKDYPSIITSSFSIVEVARGQEEQDAATLNPQTLARIDSLWADSSLLTLVDLYPAIAYEARRLQRAALTQGTKLKGPDSVHLATARIIQAEEFLTYDDKLYRYTSLIGLPIREPKPGQLAMGFDPDK